MKLNYNIKMMLIGLSPLAAGTFMSFFPWLSPLLSLVFGAVFMFIWYKMGSFAVTDRKSIIKSMILLNIPAFIFLASDFIHEKIIGAYTGIIGTITRYFFMPNMFLGTEISDVFRYNVCAVTGTEFVKDALYGDMVSVVILILFFIFGARAGKRKKY